MPDAAQHTADPVPKMGEGRWGAFKVPLCRTYGEGTESGSTRAVPHEAKISLPLWDDAVSSPHARTHTHVHTHKHIRRAHSACTSIEHEGQSHHGLQPRCLVALSPPCTHQEQRVEVRRLSSRSSLTATSGRRLDHASLTRSWSCLFEQEGTASISGPLSSRRGDDHCALS